ncbi:MAG: energy transducer TonB [Candidatus Omnitrophota bacterium]
MVRMTFSRALLFSFLWHVFCFFAVVIIVVPISTETEKFSKINFIGSLLDTDTFAYYRQEEELTQHHESSITRRLKMVEGKLPPFPKEKNRQASLAADMIKPYSASITEIIKEEKEQPVGISLPLKESGLMQDAKIKSEVADRQILFRPSAPVIQRAFFLNKVPNKGEKFQINLRFLVSPEGKVVFIEKVKSCGYPDIDIVAIEHIKKWRFAPLGPDKPKKDQEGIMLLDLEAQ